MTTFALRQGSPDETRADLVVVGVVQGPKGATLAEGAHSLSAAWGRKLSPLLASMSVTGKAGESVRVPTGGVIPAPMMLLVGLGADVDVHSVRHAAGVAARNVGNAASVRLALPATDADHVSAIAEGFLSGLYVYLRTGAGVAEVALLSPVASQPDAIAAMSKAHSASTYLNLARDWVNTPANVLNPPSFAQTVADLCTEMAIPGLTCTVLAEGDLRELQCGGILAVGAASAQPPRLVHLEYQPPQAQGHVALVGKGITFDSGGLSIKPAASMVAMKGDMAGAAAAIAATMTVASEGLPVHVTTIVPMAENMISGTAYRPGDVLTMHNGLTVEVADTDAEGRLILADALSMAAEAKPDAILNVATLTGACMVALGDRMGGVYGDDEPVSEVLAAAEAVGEPMWPMPITDTSRRAVREESHVADLVHHIGVRWGSASFAAAFLTEFTGGLPFVHLDMYGPSFNKGAAYADVPNGGTGFATRTIVEWVRRRAARV